MTEFFQINKRRLKDSRYPNYLEGLYCDDPVNSIFAALATGLLEIIIRSHIDKSLSRTVYTNFNKALGIKTEYSVNDYFVEAYPVIEKLITIFNCPEYSFAQLSDWLIGYILPGEFCINHKLIFVFKNMLLGLVKNFEIKKKIENQGQLSSGDIENLAEEVCDYFEVSIKILKKHQEKCFFSKSMFGFIPLILIEEIENGAFMLLRPTISEKLFSIENHGFLLMNNVKKMISEENVIDSNRNASINKDLAYYSKSIPYTKMRDEQKNLDTRNKMSSSKAPDNKEMLDSKLKSFLTMKEIQRSQQIIGIEGTDPIISEYSRVSLIDIRNSKMIVEIENLEVEKTIELLSLVLKENKNTNNLPAEAINLIKNLKYKELLFERVPSLRQFIHIEPSYICTTCRSIKESEEYQMFNCHPKCIICFSCRKKFSTQTCESCKREYSAYEKNLLSL